MRRRGAGTAVAGVALLLAVAGCGADGNGRGPEGADASATDGVPHGYVPGAEEAAEPQHRLVLADPGGGEVRVLDLLTEEVTDVARAEGAERALTDGRFAYLAGADGTVRIVDSGAWTVDHGDHAHYYRAGTGPREVGSVSGAGPVAGVFAGHERVAVTFGDGTVRLLDRPALEAGEVAEAEGAGTVEAAAGTAAVPYAGHVLAVAPGSDVVRAYPEEGGGGDAAEAGSCPGARGAAVTPRGVVFGCADGALLIAENDGGGDGALAQERIPYPEGTPAPERAGEFAVRPGSATLAAPAGERGVWTLDLAERAWTLTETGPVVAAVAVGDGRTLLALGPEGVLRAYDIGSGERTAERALGGGAAGIELDTSRAYVNDPEAGRVYEIDYNDGLRVARTFEPGLAPGLMTETGR
ncbi:hypothetical protein RM780_16880 [Streptomyces sp. DSM 44917]|uniref:ABC transporter n=1 Tax=Streptomyces boetiae TaxID=3075541 RepID=A0ABU2LAY1_9ACTN|nr:hypothetical protein [Streptomyces sp. DSM 44917]MDT0308621.1 hypothetical protein [Streptomyces sp. DSM 44917]